MYPLLFIIFLVKFVHLSAFPFRDYNGDMVKIISETVEEF